MRGDISDPSSVLHLESAQTAPGCPPRRMGRTVEAQSLRLGKGYDVGGVFHLVSSLRRAWGPGDESIYRHKFRECKQENEKKSANVDDFSPLCVGSRYFPG